MDLTFSVLSIVFGVSGVIFGLVTLFRNKKSDDASEGKKEGQIYTELGYIKKGIDGIDQRFANLEKNYIDVSVKIATIDASVKQAHKRIDELALYHKPN